MTPVRNFSFQSAYGDQGKDAKYRPGEEGQNCQGYKCIHRETDCRD
jgi:hypothetical protein